jgi:hypothetical protein
VEAKRFDVKRDIFFTDLISEASSEKSTIGESKDKSDKSEYL